RRGRGPPRWPRAGGGRGAPGAGCARAGSTPAASAGRPPRGARRWRRGHPAGALRSFEEGAGARFGAALGHLGRLLVFLLLERLLARVEDAADPEVEVVRARRRLPRRLVGDAAVAGELVQALADGLHAV